jgi:D-ribose pyranose/furanose isomerase RbsD
MVYVPQQLFIGAVCLATVSLFIILLPLKKRNRHPYERIDSILTPAEQHFYKVLDSVLQDSVLIMVKVRIADVIKVKRTRTMKVFWHHFSKISQKHIDFVLIDAVSFKTICLIELDDKSHTRPDRIMRDRFINQIMANSRIPLVRFKVRRRYDRTVLLNALDIFL